MARVRILGVEKVFANLNLQIKQLKGRTQRGVTLAAQLIRKKSVKMVPVATGNLRNSVFVTSPMGSSAGGKFSGKDSGKHESQHSTVKKESLSRVKRLGVPVAEVGYSAVYGLAVHENPRSGKTGGASPKGKLYKPPKGSRQIAYAKGGGWKFLEFPLGANRKRILRIIQANARIPK